MPLSAIQLEHYGKRVGFSASPAPDLATLQTLHQLHPLAIPFENLDPWLARPVSLEPGEIFEKLVSRGRGGYCYEHNLLFLDVLRTLGFTARGLAARVHWNQPPDVLPPRTHMLLHLVVDNQPYIADVGFGGLTMTAALRLEPGSIQDSPHESFRLLEHSEGYLLQVRLGDSWKAMYSFGLAPQALPDYRMANWYVSTHPQSRFVTGLVAARAAAGKRHALLDRHYSLHHTGGGTEHRELDSAAAVREVLRGELGIDLDGLPGLQARLETLFG